MTACPKCSNGTIPQFRHVEGGVCFLCLGAGKVTEATASRWLAAQLRQDLPRSEGTSTPTAPARKIKRVDLGAWTADISRDADGGFIVRICSDVGWLPMHVIVHRGKVHPVQATICQGLIKDAPAICKALTERLAA
jgi:hypothetical protein